MRTASRIALFGSLIACASAPRLPSQPAEPPPAPVAPLASQAGESSAEQAVAPRPLADLKYWVFDSPEAAFEFVLGQRPRVLGIGEAHAQRETSDVASATRRFTEDLLPLLSGRATDLVLEIWMASGQCGTVEREVAERQRPVTEHQAPSNQGEFLLLGRRAQALGIQPHALVPSCEDYAAIVNAGPQDIDRMLQMIAEATLRDVTRLIERHAEQGKAGLIVAYGGALHNDRDPRPGRESWSFGPALSERTQGAYVELDLIVPEFIKDSETWRSLGWYTSYQATRDIPGTLLYSTGQNAFVLVFPRSAAMTQP